MKSTLAFLFCAILMGATPALVNRPPAVYHFVLDLNPTQSQALFQTIGTSSYFTARDAASLLDNLNQQAVAQNVQAAKEDSLKAKPKK